MAVQRHTTKADAETLQSQVRVNLDTDKIDQMIAEFINENSEAIAKQIAADAKAIIKSAQKPIDRTGNLRRGIRARKSKYPDGGWIVQATAPHSFIIEKGRSNAPAYPYLTPALDKNIAAARTMFGAK